ncbi:hypothetical protein [Latilactobacillus sakei]|uniref:hypothetical protein n=1 Tax=Latilactobacillus sakei TaxID=1599 RepID=UPI003F535C4F
MKLYVCEGCGDKFTKGELDLESFSMGDIYCTTCSDELMQAGMDAVDPNGEFSSFDDWDENGH